MSYFMTAGGSGIDMRGLEPFELMPGALTCVRWHFMHDPPAATAC